MEISSKMFKELANLSQEVKIVIIMIKRAFKILSTINFQSKIQQ